MGIKYYNTYSHTEMTLKESALFYYENALFEEMSVQEYARRCKMPYTAAHAMRHHIRKRIGRQALKIARRERFGKNKEVIDLLWQTIYELKKMIATIKKHSFEPQELNEKANTIHKQIKELHDEIQLERPTTEAR